MRRRRRCGISTSSSAVTAGSSSLLAPATLAQGDWRPLEARAAADGRREPGAGAGCLAGTARRSPAARRDGSAQGHGGVRDLYAQQPPGRARPPASRFRLVGVSSGTPWLPRRGRGGRSEEHTSELQSLMRISYAVFCLKKKKYITK